MERSLKIRDTNDTLPPCEDQDKSHSRVKLKNNLGSKNKRSREAVIRFHRLNREKEAEKEHRSKLMLYLPWRDERVDLLGRYPDFRSHYEDKCAIILANERKYRQNATLVIEVMNDLNEHGPPQHGWDQVAPSTAEEQARDEIEGVEEERHIEQEDLDANANLQQEQSSISLQKLAANSSLKRSTVEPSEA